MGNLPVVAKKDSVQFGEYSEITKGKFSLRSYRPYDVSFEDLRPILRGRSWMDEERTGGDCATILGLEMDQESVCFHNQLSHRSITKMDVRLAMQL
jgi:hypothetical protein